MIHYKTTEEIEKMRVSARLVSQTLAAVATILKPSITTLYIDDFIAQYIKNNNAVASFKGYRGFPNSACISINDVVVHGIPNHYELKNGDIVSVDVGIYKNDFHGDSAYTFLIGDSSNDIKQLLIRTKESLFTGINQCVKGNKIGDISYAIQEATEKKYNYGVVRDLIGHGLGRKLHEDPEVPNYGKKGKGRMLENGLVIAIEPMINLGSKDVYIAPDKWSVKTKDGKPSAHYEHTVAIQNFCADVLSDFNIIEQSVKNNSHLWNEIL